MNSITSKATKLTLRTFFLSVTIMLLSMSAFAQDSLKCGPHADMEAKWESGSGICAAGKNLHLYDGTNKLAGYYIRVNLGTFEEINNRGKVVRKAKLGTGSNNGFNTPSLVDGIWSVSYIDSDFKGAEFYRTISFGNRKEISSRAIPCTGCRVGYGACKVKTNRRNGAICTDQNADGSCPADFLLCTEDVVVERDTINFSYEVSNWVFQSAENTLRYTVELSLKKDTGVFANNETEPSEFDLQAFVGSNMGLTATVVSSNGLQRIVNVSVSIQTVGKNTIELSLETPALAIGEVLYY
jgi:hypothetical protein